MGGPLKNRDKKPARKHHFFWGSSCWVFGGCMANIYETIFVFKKLDSIRWLDFLLTRRLDDGELVEAGQQKCELQPWKDTKDPQTSQGLDLQETFFFVAYVKKIRQTKKHVFYASRVFPHGSQLSLGPWDSEIPNLEKAMSFLGEPFVWELFGGAFGGPSTWGPFQVCRPRIEASIILSIAIFMLETMPELNSVPAARVSERNGTV